MSNFQFERLNAFGWYVHRKELTAGETYTVDVEESLLPAESENITLWTKGCVKGLRTDGYQTVPRVAGLFSLDIPLLVAGSFNFTCTEDSEWFCVNSRANRGHLPTLTPFQMTAGEATELPAGTLLFICTGTLDTAAGNFVSGDQLEVQNTAHVTAVEDVYGLIFGEERA